MKLFKNKGYFEKRFTFFGAPMIYRRRSKKSNGLKVVHGDVFTSYHFFKRSLIIQNIVPKRAIHNKSTWNQNA